MIAQQLSKAQMQIQQMQQALQQAGSAHATGRRETPAGRRDREARLTWRRRKVELDKYQTEPTRTSRCTSSN